MFGEAIYGFGGSKPLCKPPPICVYKVVGRGDGGKLTDR